MELNILENDKNKIVVEIKGEDHSFCNALKKELWGNKHVEAASYNIVHPLTASPVIMVETDGEEKPMTALTKAVNGLRKQTEKFKKDFKSEVR